MVCISELRGGVRKSSETKLFFWCVFQQHLEFIGVVEMMSEGIMLEHSGLIFPCLYIVHAYLFFLFFFILKKLHTHSGT